LGEGTQLEVEGPGSCGSCKGSKVVSKLLRRRGQMDSLGVHASLNHGKEVRGR
jgi:hypothetical protein